MKRGFINQKLGKRNSRRAELQRVKARLSKVAGGSVQRDSSAKRKHSEHYDAKSE